MDKIKFPRSKKALQRYIGFLNYYRNYIPRFSERLTPFFKLLKNNQVITINPELLQTFHELNNILDNCCELALKQLLKDKQMVMMTDASFSAAGHALMIEDDLEYKIESKRKTYARSRIWF